MIAVHQVGVPANEGDHVLDQMTVEQARDRDYLFLLGADEGEHGSYPWSDDSTS